MSELEKGYSWGHPRRYNDFSSYFRKIFSERVQKVSIDAGFTCPNRDGTKGTGGCTFCNNVTFKPTYCDLEKSVSTQIEQGVEFFARKYESMRFLAYFQAYTNTYAPVENLIALYEEALKQPKIVGLVLATRPDCLSEGLLNYLEKISENVYVMVELGVESCENKTLERVNRGHTFEDAILAFNQLAQRGIQSCAHMILGMPGESRETMLNQARILSEIPVGNLKLHQLQIHKNTKMALEYAKDPNSFNLFQSVEDYIEIVIEYLEILNPKIIVERFVSQSPFELLIAPKWGLKNFEFVAKVEKQLKIRDTWQGRLYQ